MCLGSWRPRPWRGSAQTSPASSSPDVTSDYLPGSWLQLTSFRKRSRWASCSWRGGGRPSCLSPPRDVLAAEHWERGFRLHSPARDHHTVGGAQVGGGQVPPPSTRESLLCLGLTRNRRYHSCRPPPSAHGQACSQGWAGGSRSIPACSGGCQLLCGTQPLPGSQTDRSGATTPPLFGAVTQKGRESGREQVAPVSREQCPDSSSANSQLGRWGQ